MDYFSCKKWIDALVLNFKAMFPALVKVTKKDLCKVLAGKPPFFFFLSPTSKTVQITHNIDYQVARLPCRHACFIMFSTRDKKNTIFSEIKRDCVTSQKNGG